MIRVTRRYRFSASHRLHTDALSAEENRALYGKCNHPFGHGHDYLLEVTVAGPVAQPAGLAVDREKLDAIVNAEIVSAFEHRNLNLDIPEFADCVPTSENVARVIQARLERVWRNRFPDNWPKLDRVRLHETERNVFELG